MRTCTGRGLQTHQRLTFRALWEHQATHILKTLPKSNALQHFTRIQASPLAVLHAIQHGRHGVAPGISGFSREFYQFFGKDLIGFNMKYITFSEKIGILSDNQRIGIITLLPKGLKDKKSLKNWRPITLLSTLYKIISGVIGNRFKKFLPNVIGQGQEGFVDGRYMGEVTRLL